MGPIQDQLAMMLECARLLFVLWVRVERGPPPALAALGRVTSGCNSTGGKTPIMMRTIAHFLPFAALAGGVLILLMPRLLNYVVAVYLILVGAIGLNNIYHFIR